MSQEHADRNLLFGILALQMDFITRDQLVAAMQAWVFDKAQPLGQILIKQKVLETEPPPLTALNKACDPQIARVAHRLIRKEPDDRYQTAEEVFEALAE